MAAVKLVYSHPMAERNRNRPGCGALSGRPAPCRWFVSRCRIR